MTRPENDRGSTAQRRAVATPSAVVLIALVLANTAAAEGYPPPPGPYPFELAPVEPAEQAGRAPAGAEKSLNTGKAAPAAMPRSQATNLFGTPPATRAPTGQPVRPATPYRAQPYAAPAYPAAPAFLNPRPAPPARPQVQTRTQPPGNTAATAAAAPPPARASTPESSRSMPQAPDPMAGGSRFRPPEPGEPR